MEIRRIVCLVIRAHGLPRTGKRAELEESVLRYIGEDADLPYPDLAEPAGPNYELVEKTIIAMQVMTSRCMVKTVHSETASDISRHVKIFLFRYADFDAEMRKETKVKMPSMLSQWNFPNLLNLAEQSKQFGSGHLMWEGGVRGEGFLRFLKPLLNTGFKGEWQNNLSKRYLRRRALKRVGIESLQDSLDDVEEEDNVRYQPCRKYKSLLNAKESFKKRQPISIIQTNNDSVGMVYKKGIRVEQLLVLEPLDGCVEVVFGAAYFSWRMRKRIILQHKVENIKHQILLLPRLSAGGEPDNTGATKYYAIADDWTEMNEDGHFGLPRIPENVY